MLCSQKIKTLRLFMKSKTEAAEFQTASIDF